MREAAFLLPSSESSRSLEGTMQRILIFGNSGAGKTTMARALAAQYDIPHLDLDQTAWETPGTRRPLADSAAIIASFVADNEGWVIEGCYADLLELVVPHATEMRFLNPGVEACVANCRRRPWEPDKYESEQAQHQMLDFLIEWVRAYDTRSDEYSLRSHRRVFDNYHGPKTEYTNGAHDTTA
jgi:adenylate kinase family enzyme